MSTTTAATVESLRYAATKLAEAVALLERIGVPDEKAGEEYTPEHVAVADLLGGVAATSLGALATFTSSAVEDACIEDPAWGVQNALELGDPADAIRNAFPTV